MAAAWPQHEGRLLHCWAPTLQPHLAPQSTSCGGADVWGARERASKNIQAKSAVSFTLGGASGARFSQAARSRQLLPCTGLRLSTGDF